MGVMRPLVPHQLWWLLWSEAKAWNRHWRGQGKDSVQDKLGEQNHPHVYSGHTPQPLTSWKFPALRFPVHSLPPVPTALAHMGSPVLLVSRAKGAEDGGWCGVAQGSPRWLEPSALSVHICNLQGLTPCSLPPWSLCPDPHWPHPSHP